jgi:type IV pilus assembly protein PilM
MKKSDADTPAPQTPAATPILKPLRRQGPGFFYRDKPIFGLDIGAGNIKAMQVEHVGDHCQVAAHGVTGFDHSVFGDGAILEPAKLATTIQELLTQKMKGTLTTRRVALSIPAARCFIRSMTVPAAAAKNLGEAIQLEVEQYIPMPLKELYLDYQLIRQTPEGTELLVVAVPQKIVNSYLELASLAGLEVIMIEPTITANTRLFGAMEQTNIPTVIIDLGSLSSDVMVYDKTLLTASTVASGGDTFTSILSKQFNISHDEAHFLKTKYGLNKSLTQKDVRGALEPLLEQLVTEIKRILRYYSERVSNESEIGQLVIMGGGSNMPGLTEYLTDSLRVPARQFAPWEKVTFSEKGVQADRYLYATATGLALLQPKELFT